MDRRKLHHRVRQFVEELPNSTELLRQREDHRRRIGRAQSLLAPDRIRELTEAEIRELFLDTRAFRFWRDKEAEFARRLAKVGLEGLKSTLEFLIRRAGEGLEPSDLVEIRRNTGLGLLLATELAAYRFPDRCWIYSPRVTLPALHALGDEPRAGVSYGHRSDPYVYFALEQPMAEIRRALEATCLKDVDYPLADLFLWWLWKKTRVRRRARPGSNPKTPSAGPSRVREGAASYSIPPGDLAPLLTGALASEGLYFTDWQIAAFYTALQVKGFVILSGISGTGKTRLAQQFAALLDRTVGTQDSEPAQGNRSWLFVPVRPDWRDSKSLLGYYNPLTSRYEWTELLRFLLRAVESRARGEDRAWFLILDEMNLARVEYYFADLLSILESGRDAQGWTREPLRFAYPEDAQGDLPPRELRLPPNLYIVGTVNTDETTYAFSPRVLDRAFSLPLTEVNLMRHRLPASSAPFPAGADFRNALRRAFTHGGRFHSDAGTAAPLPPEAAIRRQLQALNDLLRSHHLHFGYRVFDEIVSFLEHARSNGLFEPEGGEAAAFDAAVLMKVLPRFHGSRGKLERPLRDMLAWCLDPEDPKESEHRRVEEAMRPIDTAGVSEAANVVGRELARLNYALPVTAERVREMLQALYAEGFAGFS